MRQASEENMVRGVFRLTGLLLAVVLVVACGGKGPQSVQFPKLGLSAALPPGWTADAEEDATEYLPVRVEINCQGRRTIILSRYQIKADNFTAMEQALAAERGVTIRDKEKTDNGFGFTFEKKGKKLFLYFLTFGDATYQCETNDFYYDAKDVPAAIEVIKSIRKI